MDLNTLNTKTEIVNRIVVSLAVAFGGAWAWYTFNGELRRENAAAQLEKLQREVRASKRDAIDVEMKARQLPTRQNQRQIEIVVRLVNGGAIDAEVPTKIGALRVTPLLPRELPAQPRLDTTIQYRPIPLMTARSGDEVGEPLVLLPAGSQQVVLYVAQVSGPGRYVIEFGAAPKIEGLAPDKSTMIGVAQILDVD